MIEMHDITSVEHIEGWRLQLTFDNGEQREIDISELITFDGVFEPLKDPHFFRRVRVEPDVGTIVWPNGADLCPDVLYDRSHVTADAQSRDCLTFPDLLRRSGR